MTDAQQKIIDTENGQPISIVSALDEDDEDEEMLISRVPEDTSHLQACITAAQGCLLLLMLKQHIKDVYGLSDGYVTCRLYLLHTCTVKHKLVFLHTKNEIIF